MENLRWIMLAVGVGVIAVIYLIGKSKNKSISRDFPESVSVDDVPHMTTDTSYDDVKLSKDDDYQFVASEINTFELNQELVQEVSASVDDGLVDAILTGSSATARNQSKENTEIEEPEEETSETQESYQDDLIVLHVEASSAFFIGSELLRVVNQQQLKFGDMNIYHAFDEHDDIVFSMSNMLQPGHFEPEHIADMRTPGVILFMQLSLVSDPVNAFERMYRCADVLVRELGAKLTAANRRSVTEQDIQAYRKKAEYYSQTALTE